MITYCTAFRIGAKSVVYPANESMPPLKLAAVKSPTPPANWEDTCASELRKRSNDDWSDDSTSYVAATGSESKALRRLRMATRSLPPKAPRTPTWSRLPVWVVERNRSGWSASAGLSQRPDRRLKASNRWVLVVRRMYCVTCGRPSGVYPTEVRKTLTRASAAAVRNAAYIFTGSARRGSPGIVKGCPTLAAACCISCRCALSVFTYTVAAAAADRSISRATMTRFIAGGCPWTLCGGSQLHHNATRYPPLGMHCGSSECPGVVYEFQPPIRFA